MTLVMSVRVSCLPAGPQVARPDARMLNVVLDVPVPIRCGIADVVIHWSAEEVLLREVIRILLKIEPEYARVAIGSVRGKDCMVRILQLLSLRGFNAPAEVGNLKNDLERCEAERDLVGHGAVLSDPADGQLFVQQIRGKWADPLPAVPKREVPEAIPLTTSYLDGIRMRIGDVLARTVLLHAFVVAQVKD